MFSGIFGSGVSVDLVLDVVPGRKHALASRERKADKVPVFTDGEDISGVVSIVLKNEKKLHHNGIKVEFIGQLDFPADRSKTFDFFTISRDLEPPGTLTESKDIRFKFTSVDKPYESYSGVHARLRYFVRLTALRTYGSPIMKEMDVVVQLKQDMPAENEKIVMEVGIEDCLQILFEYGKSKYHLRDVIEGKVDFSVARLKLKHMELDILRDEMIHSSSKAAVHETTNVTKFELMDGSPMKKDTIPVRCFLGGQSLTPTYRNVLGKFSVIYYLNLILVDEEDRRYFKKQEVEFWRKRVA